MTLISRLIENFQTAFIVFWIILIVGVILMLVKIWKGEDF